MSNLSDTLKKISFLLKVKAKLTSKKYTENTKDDLYIIEEIIQDYMRKIK